MELKDRIKLYLKTRNEPVNRNELLSVAHAAGASRDDIYDLTRAMQDNPQPVDVNVGIWWGFKDNDAPKKGEMKTLWLRYYDLPEEDIKMFADDQDWFNKLWDEVMAEE